MQCCRQVEPLSDTDKYFNVLDWVCEGQKWLAALLSVSGGLSPTVSTQARLGWEGSQAPGGGRVEGTVISGTWEIVEDPCPKASQRRRLSTLSSFSPHTGSKG